MNNIPSPAISRRSFLRASGVSLALPFLDSMWPTRVFGAPQSAAPKRMVTICTTLGLHAPFFFPKTAGRNFEATPYLDQIKEHRDHFSVFHGLSHPEQSGADGHSSGVTWLTSAKHPGLGGFRNTISVDQFAAEKIGMATRYPSLSLSTNSGGQSYTRSGVLIPADSKPSKVFAKLFLEGSAQEVKGQMQRLKDGQSIMDAVQAETKSFQRRIGAADREKLDEYFTSVREMEQRLHTSEEWMQKPKPKLEGDESRPPQDIADESDTIGRMKLMFDMIPLALQTDSTRLITMVVNGRNDVPPVEGVTIDHHNLSHHGQDPAKIEQLRRVEEAQMGALNHLLTRLRAKKEGGTTLLDSTMVLFGSNLGNANSHDWRNIPVLLAGGGFKHGVFAKYDEKNNTPFANLFVTMLQNMGIEADRFGSSTGKLDWA